MVFFGIQNLPGFTTCYSYDIITVFPNPIVINTTMADSVTPVWGTIFSAIRKKIINNSALDH